MRELWLNIQIFIINQITNLIIQINIMIKFLKYFIFLFPLLFIYLLRPIKIIRFQKLSTEVIGAFAEHTETYLCKKKHNYNKEKNI